MELDLNQLDKAEATIAKIRTRWKEAATADVLEAQLALKRGRTGEAIEHFDLALKKDPDNKIVQFWKAQLDGQTGSVSEAAKTLEAIVRDKPVKELDAGMTLLTAAQSALASLSLRTGDLDAAIRRFEELKRSNQNGTLNKDRPLAVDHRLRRPRPVVARQARAGRPAQGPEGPADQRRPRPGRELLSPAGRRQDCPGPARLCS